MQWKAVSERFAAALALVFLFGCGGDDDSGSGGNDNLPEGFIYSCTVSAFCFNWYGQAEDPADLNRFNAATCGNGFEQPCPAQGALGSCANPSGGVGIPAGLRTEQVWYESQGTAAQLEAQCVGEWRAPYDP